MLEYIEIAGLIVAISGVTIAIIRFWSLPDRLDKLESRVEGMDIRLARIEGHVFGSSAASDE